MADFFDRRPGMILQHSNQLSTENIVIDKKAPDVMFTLVFDDQKTSVVGNFIWSTYSRRPTSARSGFR
jgi:hypothetical protein